MTSEWAEHAATSIEILGAVILVCGIAYTLIRAVIGLVVTRTPDLTYQIVRRNLARVLLLGLEVLVAADIIRTISLGIDLRSLAFLAGIVGIRIALSWSLQVETTGRWPWQQQLPDPPDAPLAAPAHRPHII